MGRVLQKRKNCSGAPRVKQKANRLKNGNKKINLLGNSIIAQNWDKKLTLTQNYRQLGLASKLNATTGGAEKRLDTSVNDQPCADPLHVLSSSTVKKLKPTEARVERDPETGKILRVIYPEDDERVEIAGRKCRKTNPLEDPLNEVGNIDYGDGAMSIPTSMTSSAVVQALERQAMLEEEALKKKQPRQQSKGEEEWLERLVANHGDNIGAMVRDKRLNPMQQTEGDIKRRLRKWKERRGMKMGRA
ncbi:66S preribosome component NOP16 [Paracoccidioides lutzii Pb01]|uniref:Nucleolar protein 16 n=1 Tax=Paracoccidioides lutzii (strain ATCC MYA-826 / Pb01) TaxID=502779 RepID=C1GZ61_PARBA|nr:66S preribosome component NOP16 [Paracoccidioides lutzii Pb01]EEH41884.1 constituent of 66S pre-ribosomal particles [Paracoccidioides lutzii Pb01]